MRQEGDRKRKSASPITVPTEGRTSEVSVGFGQALECTLAIVPPHVKYVKVYIKQSSGGTPE